MSEPLHLLLVEDSAADRRLICSLFDQFDRSPQVSTATTVGEALDALGSGRFDCALLDFVLPDGDALGILDALQRLPVPGPPALVITGAGDRSIEARSLSRGARSFLAKHRLTARRLYDAVTEAIDASGSRPPSAVRADESGATRRSVRRTLRHNRLREVRRHRQLTQTQLARRAGVSLRTVHSVEKGLACRIDTMRKLLRGLGMSFADREAVFPPPRRLAPAPPTGSRSRLH